MYKVDANKAYMKVASEILMHSKSTKTMHELLKELDIANKSKKFKEFTTIHKKLKNELL